MEVLVIACGVIALFSLVFGLVLGIAEDPKFFFLLLLTGGCIFGIIKMNEIDYINILDNPDNIIEYAQINSISTSKIELDGVKFSIDKGFVNKYKINLNETQVGDVVKFSYTSAISGRYLTSIEKQ
jgi:hypothetical protein